MPPPKTALPICTKSSTDNDFAFTAPNIETPEPNLAILRTLVELPIWQKLSIEIALPNLILERTESVDPRCVQRTTDIAKHEPHASAPATVKELPIRAKPRMEREEPTHAKLKAETREPNFPADRTERVEPGGGI